MKIAFRPTTLLASGLLMGLMALPSHAQTMDAPSTDTSGLSPLDKLFMVRAAEGNMAEIALAQLALKKTKNPDVTMIAQTIIQDHSKAQAQLQATAARKAVALPTMLSVTHMAVQDKLSKAKKNDFDKMYLGVQVDDHENTVSLFSNEVTMGQDSDAKAFANTYLPGILGHTVMIYNASRKLGVPGIELRPATPPAPPGVAISSMSNMSMDNDMAANR